MRYRQVLLQPQRIIQVPLDPLKLRRPRLQGIRLAGVEHVVHAQAQRVKVVLDAQQLQGVSPVAVDDVALQLSQAGKLIREVCRIGHYRSQRNYQAEQQSSGRRSF